MSSVFTEEKRALAIVEVINLMGALEGCFGTLTPELPDEAEFHVRFKAIRKRFTGVFSDVAGVKDARNIRNDIAHAREVPDRQLEDARLSLELALGEILPRCPPRLQEKYRRNASASNKGKRIGQYTVLEELGSSNMAVVYQAFDPVADRSLAIKVMRIPVPAAQSEVLESRLRFENEVQTLHRLSPHQNIPTFYHYHSGENGDHTYFAMELVRGESLATKLTVGAVLSQQSVLSIIKQIAAVLDHAHGKGIVHRDIKPGNVLLATDGLVKLIDFGIAHTGSQNLTPTGVRLGTPPYMAPEQIRGDNLGGQADQFSLAVLAYRLLTGAMPFEGEDDRVLYNVLHSEPPHPSRIAALPLEMDRVLLKALKKAQYERFNTCGEFAAALDSALLGSSRSSSESAPQRKLSTSPHAVAVPGAAATPRPSGSSGLNLNRHVPLPAAPPIPGRNRASGNEVPPGDSSRSRPSSKLSTSPHAVAVPGVAAGATPRPGGSSGLSLKRHVPLTPVPGRNHASGNEVPPGDSSRSRPSSKLSTSPHAVAVPGVAAGAAPRPGGSSGLSLKRHVPLTPVPGRNHASGNEVPPGDSSRSRPSSKRDADKTIGSYAGRWRVPETPLTPPKVARRYLIEYVPDAPIRGRCPNGCAVDVAAYPGSPTGLCGLCNTNFFVFSRFPLRLVTYRLEPYLDVELANARTIPKSSLNEHLKGLVILIGKNRVLLETAKFEALCGSAKDTSGDFGSHQRKSLLLDFADLYVHSETIRTKQFLACKDRVERVLVSGRRGGSFMAELVEQFRVAD